MVADRGAGDDKISRAAWFYDRAAWRLIALGYLPWLAATSLVWEVAHAPLYTLWRDSQAAYIAFAVVHCTLGDIVIGGLSLLLALSILRQRALGRWQWRRIAVLTAFLGLAYTVFSEWMNVTVLRSWAYGESMPRITLGTLDIGITPLLQWLVVPALALYLARAVIRRLVQQPD